MSIRTMAVAATLLMASTAAVPAAEAPAAAMPTSSQAAAGVNCLLFGALGAAAVFVYADVITVAVTGAINPTLLIPSMAAGFVAGCGVGNTLTPLIVYALGKPV